MALTLSRNPGCSVFVGDVKLTFDGFNSIGSTVTVKDKFSTSTFTAINGEIIETAQGFSFSVRQGSRHWQATLSIDAPKDVVILREELRG